MGMSTFVIGFKPVDELWNKMKSVYDSCKLAEIDIPKEVEQYFNYSAPDNNGIEVNIADIVSAWRDDYREGFDVDINKLPKDVHIVRFFNSW